MIKRGLKGLVSDRRGATAIEYGLILALVFLTMVGAVQFFASRTAGMFNNVAATVANAQ